MEAGAVRVKKVGKMRKKESHFAPDCVTASREASVVAMQWTIFNEAEDVKGSGEVNCSTRQGRWEETRTRQLRLLTKAARH